MRVLEIVPFRREWATEYGEVARKLKAIFGELLTDIHHIGSTSIRGMAAKPVIDILVVIRNINEADTVNEAMEQSGFEPRGEDGITGRRYLVRKVENVHTHHVHVFGAGSDQVKRHLAFRDYLREHPDEAERYRNLKMRIVEEGVVDVKLYQERKAPLLRKLQEQAEAWVQRTEVLSD